MKRHGAYRAIIFAVALTAVELSGLYTASARVIPPTAPAAAECEGAACQQVALTFDEAKQQYRVQNNSADRWVRVSAANVAASAYACVGPGKSEYLPLRSISGSYRAEYSDQSCGTADGR